MTGDVDRSGPRPISREFEGDFRGDSVKGIRAVNGDKGWAKYGDDAMELDDEVVAKEKRQIYLEVVPTLLVPLKGKNFKIAAAGEEKVDNKLAVAIKVVGPDGKDFRILFAEDTGLPVKLVDAFTGYSGAEILLEKTYDNFKDFGGFRKATRIEVKRNGESESKIEITDFRILDNVDAEFFTNLE